MHPVGPDKVKILVSIEPDDVIKAPETRTYTRVLREKRNLFE